MLQFETSKTSRFRAAVFDNAGSIRSDHSVGRTEHRYLIERDLVGGEWSLSGEVAFVDGSEGLAEAVSMTSVSHTYNTVL